MLREAGAMTADNPATNSLTAEAHARFLRDKRVLSGDWSEADWLWEELRQLHAVIRMTKGGT